MTLKEMCKEPALLKELHRINTKLSKRGRLEMPSFIIGMEGLCHLVVCSSMPLEDLVQVANREYPAGGRLQWEFNPGYLMRGGIPPLTPCGDEDKEGTRHVMLIVDDEDRIEDRLEHLRKRTAEEAQRHG